MSVNLDQIIHISLSILIFLAIWTLVEVIRIAIKVRSLLSKVEIITDVKGWLNCLNFLINKKKKKHPNVYLIYE